MAMSRDDIKSTLSIVDMLLNDASELDVLGNSTGSATDDDADVSICFWIFLSVNDIVVPAYRFPCRPSL